MCQLELHIFRACFHSQLRVSHACRHKGILVTGEHICPRNASQQVMKKVFHDSACSDECRKTYEPYRKSPRGGHHVAFRKDIAWVEHQFAAAHAIYHDAGIIYHSFPLIVRGCPMVSKAHRDVAYAVFLYPHLAKYDFLDVSQDISRHLKYARGRRSYHDEVLQAQAQLHLDVAQRLLDTVITPILISIREAVDSLCLAERQLQGLGMLQWRDTYMPLRRFMLGQWVARMPEHRRRSMAVELGLSDEEVTLQY